MEALGVDAKLLLAQVVNFCLFLYIFKRFIAKPFFEFLKKAKRQEEEKDVAVAEIKNQEGKAREQKEELLRAARDEAAKIVSEAKKTAIAAREEIVEKTALAVGEIHKKAARQIEQEREKLYADVKRQLAQGAVVIAKKALADIIDEKQQQIIFKQIVSKMNKKDLYEN